jgi:hypothetical protein
VRWGDRWALYRASRRVIREELAARRCRLDELILADLTLEHVSHERHGGPAHFGFSDGRRVCLWPTHGPTIRRLIELTEAGPVVLRAHLVEAKLVALVFFGSGRELSVLGATCIEIHPSGWLSPYSSPAG